jgi:hypothetical protein
MQISERIKAAMQGKFPTADFTEYFRFLESRKVPVECAMHSHHICPRAEFPELRKDKENLIDLEVEDHYQAHQILFECDPTFRSYDFIKGQPTAAIMGGRRVYELGIGVHSPEGLEITRQQGVKNAQSGLLNRVRTYESTVKGGKKVRDLGVGIFSPESRESSKERTKAMNADPEFKAAQAARMKNRMADPEIKAATIERLRKSNARPEVKDAKSNRMKKMSTPEIVEKRTHTRWHTNRDIINPNCTFCMQGKEIQWQPSKSMETPVLQLS